MQLNTELSKGSVTFSPDIIDLKQTFYLELFDDFDIFLLLFTDLIELNRSLVDQLSKRQREKFNFNNIVLLEELLSKFLKTHENYKKQISDKSVSSIVSNSKTKTLQELQQENQLLLENLENSEKLF